MISFIITHPSSDQSCVNFRFFEMMLTCCINKSKSIFNLLFAVIQYGIKMYNQIFFSHLLSKTNIIFFSIRLLDSKDQAKTHFRSLCCHFLQISLIFLHSKEIPKDSTNTKMLYSSFYEIRNWQYSCQFTDLFNKYNDKILVSGTLVLIQI